MTNSTVHIEDALVTGGTKPRNVEPDRGLSGPWPRHVGPDRLLHRAERAVRIYRRQDHLSSITVTIVYAVFAAGIVTSLLLVGHLSDWYGRRTLLIPALLTGLVAAVIFANSTSLPALFIGRVLTGLALGAATATATAYLTDLDSGPNGVPTRRAQITSTVANVGGLAVGPLAAGLLATYVPSFPRLIYVILAVLLALAVAATWAAPEVRPLPKPRPRYRPQRLALPAAARTQFGAALTGDFLVFTVYGVFAGLASAFLSGRCIVRRPYWPA